MKAKVLTKKQQEKLIADIKNYTKHKVKEKIMKNKGNVLPIEDVNKDAAPEFQPKTDKKYLKAAEQAVRRLDNVLSDLHTVAGDARILAEESAITDVSEKDHNRFVELYQVITAAEDILYHVTNRMARKYVGKEVETLDDDKRKSLKKK